MDRDHPRAETSRRTPRWRTPLLILHLVATVGLIGITLALIALGVASVRGADPRTIYPAAYLIEAWVVAPLAVLALGTGLLQGLRSQWGLVQYWWVTIKLATTAALIGVILFVLLPRLATSADAAMAGQPFGPAERLPLAIAPGVGLTLLLLNVVLAVYKPRWRIQSGERRVRVATARTGQDIDIDPTGVSRHG